MAKKAQAEFIRWFGPLLDALRDLGDSGNLDLPDELLDQTLKSGGSKFHNQVAWARQYLVGKVFWIHLSMGLGPLQRKDETHILAIRKHGRYL